MNFLEKNFITKNDISQILEYKTNQIPYILAPMGSGKTTAISNFISDLEPTKRILILSPYIISNQEFKNKISEKIINNCDITYYTKICLQLHNEVINYMKQNKLKGFHLYGELLINKIDKYFNGFDYIFLDELDFVAIQGIKNKHINLFDYKLNNLDENGHINMFHLLVIFLKRLALNTNIHRLALSANKIKIPPQINGYANNIIERASSVVDTNNRYIDYIIFNGFKYREIKSRIKITDIVVVKPYYSKIDNDNSYGIKHTSMLIALGSIINDSIKNNIPTLIFKSKGYDKREAKLLMKYNVLVLQRYENTWKIFNEDKQDIDTIFRDYPNFKLIGSDESILSNELIEKYSVIAVNTSSTRAVSIDGLKNKKARIIILEPKITTTVTQMLGRFRDANVEVYFLNLNDNVNVTNSINSKDMFLLKHIEPIRVNLNDVSELVGLYIGKINTTLESKANSFNNVKTQLIKRFLTKYSIDTYKSKLAFYKMYLSFIQENQAEKYKVSRNTFYKYLNQIKGKTND